MKEHYSDSTVFSRRIKRLRNDIAITKKHILNTKSIKHLSRFSTKNLNIILKYLKSSHSENEETHSTIIYCLLKSDSYLYLDIARQKKENVIVIATSTRNPTSVSSKNHIPQRVITSLLSDPFSQY